MLSSDNDDGDDNGPEKTYKLSCGHLYPFVHALLCVFQIYGLANDNQNGTLSYCLSLMSLFGSLREAFVLFIIVCLHLNSAQVPVWSMRHLHACRVNDLILLSPSHTSLVCSFLFQVVLFYPSPLFT